MAVENVADRAEAYGMPGEIVDGNDIFAVWDATDRAIERARNGHGPTLIECKTFRMTGHSAHDDAGYVPPGTFRVLGRARSDPQFERALSIAVISTPPESKNFAVAINREIDEAIQLVAEKDPFPDPEDCLKDVYYEGE